MSEGTTTITIEFAASDKRPWPPFISDGSHISISEHEDENFTTDVSPGNKVIFKLFPGGMTLSEVIILQTPPGFFKTKPTEANNWTGVIGSLPMGNECHYGVIYLINEKNRYYFQDPKLRMH